MPTSRKTVGVIGLGSIGMRRARNLIAMGHRVYGFDPDKSKEEEFKALGGFCLGAPYPSGVGATAIVIASPSERHYDDMYQGLSRGFHVFVEKPIATKLGDRYAYDGGLKVMVGNNLRFHSCVKKAKEWLDAGLIGQPLWANFTLAQRNTKYTDDVVLNWGSHELDLARYLLGTCWVTAAVGMRDIADITLMHSSGCRTTVHLDYMTEPEYRGFGIFGTKARIGCNLVYRTAWVVGADKVFHGNDSFSENYIEEMQAFLDRIDGKETLGATGEDGLAVLELCLRAKSLAGIS